MRAISNRHFLDTKFESADFDGPWADSFGKPSLSGSWLIWGGSGTGKTTFTLLLAKYLTRFGLVAYNSLEQGDSPSLQIPWRNVGMSQVGNKIVLLHKVQLKELKVYLKKRKSPRIVIIDSVKYLLGFKLSDYTALKDEFPDKLFIFIAHEKNREPAGAIAEMIRYDADVKIRTEGFKAFVTTRYEGGGADFIIWDKGANDYWFEKL